MALDSLYGGGILAQGLGQGLQGLVEGYKLKRELDNQSMTANSMMGYRSMMGSAASERGDAAEARASLLKEQLDRLQSGESINGAQPAGKKFDPVAAFKMLSQSNYARDPAQMNAAMQALAAGKAPPAFIPPQKSVATAGATAPADGMSLWGAIKQRIAGTQTQQLAPASAAPVVQKPGYNWRAALQSK